MPDLTLEDLKTIVPLITDKEKTLIKQYLNIEELKQFIKELKSSVDSDKDEKYWQNIITQNNWVLSQLFPYPFVFHGDKVHIGGQTLEKEGGICDFLVKNEITSNVSLIEIKANTDQLVNNQPYRKGLNTYSMSDNVIGGVVQLLDYKNTLMAHSIQLLSPEKLNSFNPQCVLIIGRIGGLNADQKRSFELYRSEINSVTIITYDELINRVELILTCLEKKDD